MKDSVNVEWKGDMAFHALLDDHVVEMDARTEVGGHNQGPRPKALIMASLAGCTGMDVISILKKMKITPDKFSMRVEATLADDHPKRYTALHLIYEFGGNDLPLDKIRHAIELSQEKYCGVSATLKDSVTLSYEIVIQ